MAATNHPLRCARRRPAGARRRCDQARCPGPGEGRTREAGTCPRNRFFPALGNHDWRATDLKPHTDYREWGATAVIAGHHHHYERIEIDGMLYFVNGLGGNPNRYAVKAPVEGSVVRYNDDHGAMRVFADAQGIRFEFVTRAGVVVDTTVRKAP